MRWTFAVVVAVMLPGCGTATGDPGLGGAEITARSVETTATGSGDEPDSSAQSPAGSPGPDGIDWLAPPSEFEGLRLIAARRELIAGCGPAADCEPTVPSSTLEFDTADLTTSRSLTLRQTFDNVTAAAGDERTGGLRTVGERSVVVDEQGDADTSYITAAWSEPGGIDVELQTVGLSWEQVQEFIVELHPTDAADWPGIRVDEPLGRCVGDRTRYAPGEVPAGWNRFVLDAAPVGACDVDTFLFMSLVIPGTDSQPGTLVTFVSSPASGGILPEGEPVDINGVEGRLQQSSQPDGTPATSIAMQLGDVLIDAHGNADRDTLVELMTSVRVLDETEWSQLVAEIDAG